MVSFGSFIFAPFAYNWYPYLETLFPNKGDLMNTIFKVGIDQSIGAVTVLMLLNFYVTLINTNGNLNAALKSCGKDLWQTLKVNWYVYFFLACAFFLNVM